MIFANAWILALGALAAGIPVAMHLMARRRPKPTPFPTIRWLSETMAAHRSRHRLKHLILLILRVVAVLWLALAFAQPSVAEQDAARWVSAAFWGLPALGALGIAAGVAMSDRPGKRWWLIGSLSVALLFSGISSVLAALAWVRGSGAETLGGEGPVAAVVLVDVAPRMEYRQAGKSRLETALEFADRILQQLPPDSRAAVVPSGGGTPFFAVDVAAARRQLESLRMRPRHDELPERIVESLDLLAEAQSMRHEIYVLTDRSRRAWPEGNAAATLRQRLEAQEASLYLIDVRADSDENVRLGLPRLERESITTPGVLELEIDLINRGAAKSIPLLLELEQPDPSRPVRRDDVTLVPDRVWTRSAIVEVPENGAATARFSIPDLPPGVHHGSVSIEGSDPLALDDRRWLTVAVREPWRGLVLADPTARPEILTEAIAPAAERAAGRAAFEFEVLEPERIGQRALQDYDAIFLLDPRAPDEATWELLRDYVVAGGGLAIFFGPSAESPDADPLGYRPAAPAFRGEAAGRLLPGRPTEVWDRRRAPVSLAPTELSHPLLAPFRGLESSVPWSDFPIAVHWGWETYPPDESNGDETTPAEEDETADEELPSVDRRAEVMRYTDGTPAIVERVLGAGRVVVWTSPIGERVGASDAERWSRLTVGECWPYFLLANRLAEHLVAIPDARLNRRVGDVVDLEWEGTEPPETLTYFPPDGGEPERVRGQRQRWTIRFTDSIGHYRFKGGDPVRTLGFSINVDETETDLEPITDDELDERLGAERYRVARELEELRREQGSARRGESFFGLLVSILPWLMAAEYLFAQRFHSTAGPVKSIAARGETSR